MLLFISVFAKASVQLLISLHTCEYHMLVHHPSLLVEFTANQSQRELFGYSRFLQLRFFITVLIVL